MNLNDTLARAAQDIADVQSWVDTEYNKYFAGFFEQEHQLYDKMKKPERDLSDEDLQWIITLLPMDLFSVAENLNKMKVSQEVIRLEIKQTERKKKAAEKEAQDQYDAEIEELKLLVTAYTTITERVEKELSFSRELIMGAKKVWDSRAHQTEPGALGSTLPEIGFDVVPQKQYIK